MTIEEKNGNVLIENEKPTTLAALREQLRQGRIFETKEPGKGGEEYEDEKGREEHEKKASKKRKKEDEPHGFDTDKKVDEENVSEDQTVWGNPEKDKGSTPQAYKELNLKKGNVASAGEFERKQRKAITNKDDKKTNEEIMQNEETLAGSSLHPAAKAIPDPKAVSTSKVEMMKHMVNYAAGMSKGDLTKWFEDAMKVYGPGKTHGVGDVATRNVDSINSKLGKGPHTKEPMPKIHVREDLDEIFAGTELTEEFKEKVSVLFESAVHARLVLETASLEEEFVNLLQEEIEYFTETLTGKLDTYLDYTVENWMEENKLAVESALRNELTSDFIEGLKTLFTEHYIDIPEDKVDVLNVLADKVTSLEATLEDLISENAILKDALVNEAKQDIFEEVSQGLTIPQIEKFATLSEGVDFDGDFDAYTKKLEIIKESHFSGKVKKVVKSNILEESFEGEIENKPASQDPAINRYVAAISRNVKSIS